MSAYSGLNLTNNLYHIWEIADNALVDVNSPKNYFIKRNKLISFKFKGSSWHFFTSMGY